MVGEQLWLYLICGTGVPTKAIANMAYVAFKALGSCTIIPIPNLGRSPLEESYREIERFILADYQQRMSRVRTPARCVLGGHSQGGYHAVRFAADHPEISEIAIPISTPFGGTHRGWGILSEPIRQFAPSLHALMYVGPEVIDLRDQVREAWPAEVGLRMVAAAGDRFVRPRRSAYALEVPPGTDIGKFFLGRTCPPDLPDDVQFRRSIVPGHLLEVFDPALWTLVYDNCRERPKSAIRPVGVGEAV